MGANAQTIYDDMMKEGKTFYQIQQQMDKYYQTHSTGKGSGYKQYQRWAHEISYKIDANGKLITPNFNTRGVLQRKQLRTANANGWNEKCPTTILTRN